MFERFMPLRVFEPIREGTIYVLCLGGIASGGPELLHQLVNALVQRGRKAYIVYTPTDQIWETPAEYRRYNCPVATETPDMPEVAVLVPEVSTNLLFRFSQARKIVWWLSVDYYQGCLIRGWMLLYVRRLFESDMPYPRKITHLCQSAYAREFVSNRFSVKAAMLSDYLAKEFLNELTFGARDRRVAYNPKKGMAFTRDLIAACPEIAFVALENMSREEMRRSLACCSVYIDFGRHPGKDRIPREAAMCGAVVVVGREGSARNTEDVPLNNIYKVKTSSSSIPKIRALLCDIFHNFSFHQSAQDAYRVSIAGEKELFSQQLEHAFNCRTESLLPP